MKILLIITGSNGGIGKELKLQYFNDKKYLVMGVDLESKNSLENEHYFLKLDFSKKFTISRQAKILNKIKHIKNKNNLKKIILINNAAVQIIKPIQNVELNDIEESISVNLTYPMMLSKLLLRVTSPKDLKIFNQDPIIPPNNYDGKTWKNDFRVKVHNRDSNPSSISSYTLAGLSVKLIEAHLL